MSTYVPNVVNTPTQTTNKFRCVTGRNVRYIDNNPYTQESPAQIDKSFKHWTDGLTTLNKK